MGLFRALAVRRFPETGRRMAALGAGRKHFFRPWLHRMFHEQVPLLPLPLPLPLPLLLRAPRRRRPSR